MKHNVLIVTQGPKKGQVFTVPSTPKRKLPLRRAKWLLVGATYERALGFLWGYRAGVSKHPWTKA